MLSGSENGGGVVGLGVLSWEGRGCGLEGAVGDCRPDLINKSAENNFLDFNKQCGSLGAAKSSAKEV